MACAMLAVAKRPSRLDRQKGRKPVCRMGGGQLKVGATSRRPHRRNPPPFGPRGGTSLVQKAAS